MDGWMDGDRYENGMRVDELMNEKNAIEGTIGIAVECESADLFFEWR